MKIIKLGIIVLVILGLGACTTKQEVPVLSDEIIRIDAKEAIIANALESIDALSYTIEKTTKTNWVIRGTMTVNTDLCVYEGTFILYYSYNGTAWILGSKEHEVTGYVSIVDPQDKEKPYSANTSWFWGAYDDIIAYQDLDSATVIVDKGTQSASYVYEYTVLEGPMTSHRRVTVPASFSYPNGWVYSEPSLFQDTTYDFTKTYVMTWDILDSETYFTNGETMTIKVTGKIRATGSSVTALSIEENSLTAVITFRGKTIEVKPSEIPGENINTIELKFGTGAKEVIRLAYGQEAYRDSQNMGNSYYLISAEGSHAR